MKLLPAALALALSLIMPSLHAEQTLRILTWPGYADPDLVEAFEQEQSVEVEVTFVGSDDELRQKLSADGGRHYDVVAANTSEIRHFVERRLLQPIDLEQLQNRSRQLRQFRVLESIPGLMREHQAYGIPFTYGEMGLIYDRRQFDSPPQSLQSLWDPRWRGKVLAYDGSSHNFSLARQALGKLPFQIEETGWPASINKLVELRRNVLGFYSLPEESVEIFTRHQAALLYANYGRQQLKLLRDAGLDVEYVIPQEGALAWLDCWAISAASSQRGLAERWINYTLSPAFAKAFSQRQGLANTLEPLPAGTNGHLIWLESVEDASRRAQLWQRILAGERPEHLVSP